MWRWIRRLAWGLAALILLCAVPVLGVEVQCRAPAVHPPPQSRYDIADAGYRRAEGDSFLTYPEWYIVHAYADLAGVTEQRSESAFDYLASVIGFWRSLCHATRVGASVGPVSMDQRVTNYVIGISFTAELGLQGVYERTIGAVTLLGRGQKRTPEDEFNATFLQDYAAFLQQTPWYRYPFAAELRRFWRETPWSSAAPVRSLERRAALSLEFSVKAAYAFVLGAIAGYDPADLTLRSVMEFGSEGQIPDPRVKVVRAITSKILLVETPRYAAFTEIIRQLAQSGGGVLEIAGNDRILTTVLAPAALQLDVGGATKIFSIPLQAKPGWQRVGLDTPVTALAAQIAGMTAQGASFEHAYDY